MFHDARKLPRGGLVERDVCVVGGGAAGIAIARELSGRGVSVALLESGGREPDPATQDLYRGRVEGDYLAPGSDYLTSSRLRYLGGTTNHWTGLCAPLEDLDFETRSWIPHSGWPFGRAELEPFYARAAPLLAVGPFGPDAGSRRPLAFGPGSGIETRVKQFSPPIRFAPAFAGELAAARGVDVYLHANAVDLESGESGAQVAAVSVATLSGNAFRVRARRYVLAAGGIENARLLLCANSGRGLGNDRDQVGRYFMDHLFQLGELGRAVFAAPPAQLALYARALRDAALRRLVLGRFVLSDRLQREHALPHHAVALLPLERPDLWTRSVASLASDLAPPPAAGSGFALLGMDLEPIPDPDNRVVLADDRDALGMRRATLRWRVTAADREGALRFARAFARELGRTLRGRAAIALVPDYDWSRFAFSSHHVGTTRMHGDPARGVVDADARVHGVANLHVAGSSVFPTAGLANPTLTIVALSLRLADHLARELRL